MSEPDTNPKLHCKSLSVVDDTITLLVDMVYVLGAAIGFSKEKIDEDLRRARSGEGLDLNSPDK